MAIEITNEEFIRALKIIKVNGYANWLMLKLEYNSSEKATRILQILQEKEFLHYDDNEDRWILNIEEVDRYLNEHKISESICPKSMPYEYKTRIDKHPYKEEASAQTEGSMIKEALNIFNWEGRICRRQYFAVMFFFGIIAWVIARSSPSVGVSMSASVVLEVFKTPTYIKRLHDMNKSGWLILLVFVLSLIPIVNIGVGLILLFSPGTHGPNEYGEDPRKEKRFPHEAGNSVTEKREPINISKTAYPNLTSCGYTRNTSQQAYPEECPTWISPASWWIAGIIGIISSIGMAAGSRGDNIQTGEKFLLFLYALLVGTLVWKWISYVALFVIFLSWKKIKKWTSIVTQKINILFDSGVASIAQKVTSAVQAGKAHAEVKLEKQKLKERANDLELQRLQQRVADLEKELNNTSSRR